MNPDVLALSSRYFFAMCAEAAKMDLILMLILQSLTRDAFCGNWTC